MKKWKCVNEICKEGCELTVNYSPVQCPRGIVWAKWQEMGETVAESNQLPKLTAEVFGRPDCPEWAKWVAVDLDGSAYFYGKKPSHTAAKWHPVTARECKWIDRLVFDPTDWQNSLIERPARLPKWCKVGGYGYAYDSGYFKIIEIIDGGKNLKVEWIKEGVQGTVFGCNIKCKKQSRLRPYNDIEMRGLVGKVICTCEGKAFMVIAYADGEVSFGEVLHTAEDLVFDMYKFQDGSPCGKLEHLENGEWVE